MPGLYAQSGGVNRQIKKLYAQSGGVNRQIKKLYANVGGVNRKIFSAIELGASVVFGSHNWIVVNIDTAAKQAVLICKDDVGTSKFSDGGYVGWDSGHCTIRDYLNSTFYNVFSASEKAQIVTRHTPSYSFGGIGYTDDAIWIPSMTEIGLGSAPYVPTNEGSTIFQYFVNNHSAATLNSIFGTGVNWSRTSRSGGISEYQLSFANGYTTGEYNATTALYFRPSMIINI
jgi:hypothetical protein